MEQRPASVTRAVQLVWLLVVLSLVVTVLAVVFDDDLVAMWAGGEGLTADDTRVPPSFTPVVIVLYVVVVSTLLVLLSFFTGGHNWARHSIAVGVVLIAISTVAGIQTGPPAVFVVAAALSLVLDLALLVLLYLPSTSAYLVAGPWGDEPGATPSGDPARDAGDVRG